MKEKPRCRSWKEEWLTSVMENGRPTNMGRGMYRFVCVLPRGHKGKHQFDI